MKRPKLGSGEIYRARELYRWATLINELSGNPPQIFVS